MSSIDEKQFVVTQSEVKAPTQNVLTISRPTPARQQTATGFDILSTIEDEGSVGTISPPPTARLSKQEKDRAAADPDMFEYLSSGARHNNMESESKTNINVCSFDTDVEALTPQQTEASQTKTGLLKAKCKSAVDPAWPGRNHLKQQKKQAKRDRAMCACWANMGKMSKRIIVTAAVLLIIGAALGIGFGVSKKVGGTTVDGKPIPNV